MKIRKAVAKAVFAGIHYPFNMIILLLLMFVPFLSSFFKKYFFYLFIWEREKERESKHTQAGEGGGKGRSRLPTEQGAQCRAQYQDPEIMTWAEGRSLANWASEVPFSLLFILLSSV